MKRKNTLKRRNSLRLKKSKRRNSRLKKSLKHRKIRGGIKKKIYLGGGRDTAWNGISLYNIFLQQTDRYEHHTEWCHLICLSQKVSEYIVYALIIIPKDNVQLCRFIFFRMSDLYRYKGRSSEYLRIWPGSESVWRSITETNPGAWIINAKTNVVARRENIVKTFEESVNNIERYKNFLEGLANGKWSEITVENLNKGDLERIAGHLGLEASSQESRQPSQGSRQPSFQESPQPSFQGSQASSSSVSPHPTIRTKADLPAEWEEILEGDFLETQKEVIGLSGRTHELSKLYGTEIDVKELEIYEIRKKLRALLRPDLISKIKAAGEIKEIEDMIEETKYIRKLLPDIKAQEYSMNFAEAWEHIRKKINSSMVQKSDIDDIYKRLKVLSFRALSTLLRTITPQQLAQSSTDFHNLKTEVNPTGSRQNFVVRAENLIMEKVKDKFKTLEPHFNGCASVVIENTEVNSWPIHIYEFDYYTAYTNGKKWENAKTITPIGILKGGKPGGRTSFDVLVVPRNTLLFFRVDVKGDSLEKTKLSISELIGKDPGLVSLYYTFCTDINKYVSIPWVKQPLMGGWTNTPDFVVDKLWENLRDSN